MKKWILFFTVIFLVAESLWATGITYTFADGEITGTSPKYYEFNLMVTGSSTGSKIGDCMAFVNYNATGFGSSVTTNGKITVTKGTLVNNAYYDITVNDNTTSRFAITVQYLLPSSPTLGSDLPATATQWAHVKIEIQNSSVTAGLNFQSSLMNVGTSKESDNTASYDPITSTDEDDTSLPVQFAGISATAAAGEGVTLTWQTESEVDSYGFNVWRSEEREGTYVKLTTQVIQSAGNTSSRQEYTFTDAQVQAGVEYWYKVEELSSKGESTFYGPIRAEGMGTVPDAFALSSNYPNPFNPETSFSYDVPQSAPVRIAVYSLIGQEITTLVEGTQEAGHYEMKWDGKDAMGRPVSSGIYFLRMEAGTFRRVGKMTLLR